MNIIAPMGTVSLLAIPLPPSNGVPQHSGTSFLINGFTQCHACVVQTTTRYAGVHKKLYKKITNRITIRMFKSIVKKKGDFNGK